MLKITPFKIDHKVLRNAVEKQMRQKYAEQFEESRFLYRNTYESAQAYESEQAYNDRKLTNEQLENRTTEITETWINPRNIRKILRCTNTVLGKNFLKIIMDDGEMFFVEANSIQEFMMKNVIIGNEVD